MDRGKLGYLFVVCGVCLYSCSDAIMKYYNQFYSVQQVTFFRTTFRFIPFFLLVIYKKINPFRSKKVKENFVRAVLASIGTFSFMYAYRYANMTDVFVIGSTTAIFVIPFSVLFLGEKFSAQNFYAVLLGFFGICLAFRPGYGIFQMGALFAVFGAIISALNQVIIKKLCFTESELTIIFYHNTVLLFFTILFGYNTFVTPNFRDFGFFFVGGAISALAQYCMIHAFKLSTSSGLASAGYFMIIPTVFFDVFLFRKTPDLYIICGLILILMGLIKAYKIQSKLAKA